MKDAWARLEPALEQRKALDAQRMRETRAEMDKLAAERAAIQAGLDRAPEHIDHSDFVAWAAYERWRSQQRVKMQRYDAAMAHLDKEVEERRTALARSNGEVESLRTLLGKSRWSR